MEIIIYLLHTEFQQNKKAAQLPHYASSIKNLHVPSAVSLKPYKWG